MLWFILTFVLSLRAWRAVIKETFKDVSKEEKEQGKIATVTFFGFLLVIFVGFGTLLACIPNGIIRDNITADVETYCKEQVEIAPIPYASGEGTVYLLLDHCDCADYYYYAFSHGPGIILDSLPVENTVLVPSDTETPRIEVMDTRYTDESIFWFSFLPPRPETQYYIYFPENSILDKGA